MKVQYLCGSSDHRNDACTPEEQCTTPKSLYLYRHSRKLDFQKDHPFLKSDVCVSHVTHCAEHTQNRTPRVPRRGASLCALGAPRRSRLVGAPRAPRRGASLGALRALFEFREIRAPLTGTRERFEKTLVGGFTFGVHRIVLP